MPTFKNRVNQIHSEMLGIEIVKFVLEFEKEKVIEENIENENLHLIVFNVPNI